MVCPHVPACFVSSNLGDEAKLEEHTLNIRTVNLDNLFSNDLRFFPTRQLEVVASPVAREGEAPTSMSERPSIIGLRDEISDSDDGSVYMNDRYVIYFCTPYAKENVAC